MRDLGGLLRLIRPINALMMGFAVIVGAVMGAGIEILCSWRSLFLGFTTGFTLTCSAMAINDYYDREIDSINEPGRPIPSGAVTPREALAVSMVLSAVGIFASWLTSPACLAVAVLSWAIMSYYSTRGKRTGFRGNLLVSACIALPFIYGGLAVDKTVSASSLFFSLLAFMSNTGREVTKGIVDIEGDRKGLISTVAVSRGAKAAAATAAAFYISAVAISFLPLCMGLVSIWYGPFVALTDLGLIYESYSLVRDPCRENSRRVKNRVLIWMALGLIGFIAGRLP